MFVYTTKFEAVSAYSTARKAIESQISPGYNYADMTNYTNIAPGADWVGNYVEVVPENVAKIIAFVNKHGRVDIMHGNPEHTDNQDRTEISKVRVR